MVSRRLIVRLAKLVAILFLSVVPLGLIEIGLWITGTGPPTGLFVTTADPDHLFVNPHFTDVYFRAGLARPLKPAYIRARKEEGAYRIFVLGASAAVGFPDWRSGFSRKLEVLLRHGFPDLEIEVTNLGTAAINSHVVFDIARYAAEHDPDLFIVYLGNNEVIGPFGPAAQMAAPIDDVALIRVVNALRRLRISRWVRGLVSAPEDSSWRGMKGLTYDPIRRSDPRMETVYANFRRNLDDIRRVALASDARILFASVVTNLVDFAPFGSEHRIDLSEAESREWSAHFRSGSVALDEGDPRRAVALLTEAVKIDPEHAETRFKLGKAHLESGDWSVASTHLLLARDLDAIRLRSDSTLNAIIKEIAGRGEEARVSFLDVAALGEDGLHGLGLLLEHVHFSSEGSDWLARTLFDAVADDVARDTGRVARPVDLSPDDLSLAIFDVPPVRIPALRRLERLVSSPPFLGRYRNDELVKSIRQRIRRLEATPFAMSDAVIAWLSEDPDDFASHRRAFEYLGGRLRDARAAGDEVRISELLAWADRLQAIPGANRDMSLRRAQWSQQLAGRAGRPR